MVDDSPEKFDILRSSFLFTKLSDLQITRLAEVSRLRTVPRGEKLYTATAPATTFYFVREGKVRLVTSHGKGKRPSSASLVYGDFFGEDCFIGKKRLDTAVAMEETSLLEIGKDTLRQLFISNPEIQRLIAGTAKSRLLARHKNFKWLGDDEAVYVIARVSPFFLVLHLILPGFFILFSLGWLVFNEFSGASLLFPAIPLVLSVIWFIWVYFDWENDYYAVTSKRVLHIEKIIALYDSLQEAPLEELQSVKKDVQPIVRLFTDYGTVIMNTYTGSIVMNRAQKPDLIIQYAGGFQARAGEIARQMDNKEMAYAIRRRLGYRDPTKEQAGISPGSSAQVGTSNKRKRSPGLKLEALLKSLRNILKLRYQDGTDIFYRRHWVILIRKTWMPGLIILLMGLILVALIRAGALSTIACGFFFIAFLVVAGWWLYQFVDWRDDIFILTLTSVIDIDKKPLTRVEKRAASLERILSLEYTRKGLSAIFFNYGTVIINIGTEKFSFNDVVKPASVQYEISGRMNALRRRKKDEEANREREKVANWLAIYHEQVEELEDLENNPSPGEVSG